MGMMRVVLVLLFLQQADHHARGIEALEKKDYPAAVVSFAKAADADPNDHAAHFHLALARSLSGEWAAAIGGYRKVLELKPGLYEAELNLGILLLEQKQAEAAIPSLRAATEKKPKEFRPNYYLAEALLAAGQPSQAEPWYQSALKLDAKSAAAERGLARSLASQQKLDDAAPHFRRAAELDPAYRDALLELAGLYEAAKRPLEAIPLYEQFPEDPAARERLGELLLEAGRPEEAVRHLEFAVARSPTAANRLALATAYLRSKQPDKAVAAVEQAIAAAPDDLDLRLFHGRLLRDQKNFRDAARQFYFVVQKRPDSREAWSELAAMLNALEQHPQALAALDRLEALGESGPAIHYLRAIMLDRLQQHAPALASYEKFLALAAGRHPEEEFKARQRVRILKKEIGRR